MKKSKLPNRIYQPTRYLTEYCFNPDFRILFSAVQNVKTGKWEKPQVTGEFWRLYYCHTPGAVLTYRDEAISLSRDKIYLIAPDTVFSTGNSCAFTQFYIHFLAGQPFSDFHSEVFTIQKTAILNDILTCIISGYAHESLGTFSFALYSQALLCLIFAQHADRFQIPRQFSEKLPVVLKYIEKNLHLKITNSDLAKQVNMSKSSFIAFFKRNMGEPPGNYLKSKRIQRAAALLIHTDKPIAEIAGLCGFYDRYHFSKVFLEICNISPGRFRIRNSSHNP